MIVRVRNRLKRFQRKLEMARRGSPPSLHCLQLRWPVKRLLNLEQVEAAKQLGLWNAETTHTDSRRVRFLL